MGFRGLVAVFALASLGARAASASGGGPCGGTAPPPPRYEHVVWIWFENHGYGDIVGAPDAPYMNGLAAHCGLATNYQALTHPSLPNYIAATSGLALDALGPLRADCDATGDCQTSAASIFSQAPSWGAYVESMRQPCTRVSADPYAANHNPPVYYSDLATCDERDLRLRRLWHDVATEKLPAFVFITPNTCDSMHSCPVSVGDRWLGRVLARLTRSAAYRRGAMVVFVTFDESADDDPDDRVATFVVSRSTGIGLRSGDPFTHYSLLRTTEELLGLGLLGEAATAPSMRPAFHL